LRGRIDAVFDLASSGWSAAPAPALPVLYWALGNLPRGASLLSTRRRQLKTNDVLLVNSSADLTLLDHILGGSGPRGRLVRFGVDTEAFRPLAAEERRAARRDLGFTPDEIVVVYAGRLNLQKNVHALIRLVAAARREVPALTLALAGAEDTTELRAFGVSNEGYRGTLESLTESLGISPAVRFFGALADPELARLLAASDVFASLSLHHDENFGYAPVEAMACGLPALVSDWGGYRDSVRHEVTGWRIPTLMTLDGVRALWRRGVPALVRLALDPLLRSRIGDAARAEAVSTSSLDAFARSLGAVVAEASGRPPEGVASGAHAFRVHPLAARQWARNALRHLAAERSGRPLDHTLAPEDYPSYRFFLGPYATADVGEAVARPDDRPVPILPAIERAAAIETIDPIWPRRIEIDLTAARPLLDPTRADGSRTIAELASGPSLSALLATATELARRGVVDLGRGFAFEAEASAEFGLRSR
jgi:glycosyltransferase involved in cell wall biosynthesis